MPVFFEWLFEHVELAEVLNFLVCIFDMARLGPCGGHCRAQTCRTEELITW